MKKEEAEIKLQEFTKKLKKIPEIMGAYYTGSTATKTRSKYSDIDIDIVVEDKNYKKIVKKLPKLFSMCGDVRLVNHYKNLDETYAFIVEDYEKVEIDPIKKSKLKEKLGELRVIRIGFDKKGIIKKKFVGKEEVKKIKLNHEEFVHLLLDTRANFIYIVRHFARGKRFSAVEEITTIRNDLFHLLARLKGLEDWKLTRNVEKLLSRKELDFVKNSICKNYEKKELRKAIKANWEFMKHIEREYEKKAKRKLNLKCNDKEILEVIDERLR